MYSQCAGYDQAYATLGPFREKTGVCLTMQSHSTSTIGQIYHTGKHGRLHYSVPNGYRTDLCLCENMFETFSHLPIPFY